MTSSRDPQKQLADIHREVDCLAAQQLTRKSQGIGPSPEELPNIISFATDPHFLGRSLYSRQGTTLKCMFLGRDLKGRSILTDYDHEVIAHWINRWKETGAEGIQPDIYERMEQCWNEGRHWFAEVVLPIGRRGSKNFLGGIAGAYIKYFFHELGDVHGQFGIDRDQRLSAMVFAGQRDQAKANQWRALSQMIQGAECFDGTISRAQSESLTLWGKYQDKQELSKAGMDKAIFEIVAKQTTQLAGRGWATFMLIFDEIAHILPVEHAGALYESAKPSLAQFGPYGFILMPSSPWQKVGKFYERYELGFDTDEETGAPVDPTIMVLQLPSWDLYEDWERTGPGGIMALPPVKDSVLWYPRKNGPMLSFDTQLEREERANPETFRVEYRAHFGSIIDAYLSEGRVNDIFELGWPDGTPLSMKTNGILPKTDYFAHGDPSKSGANFGFAIAHMEPGELEGEPVNYAVFDVLHAWIPGDFDYNNYEIDYLQIEKDLKSFINRFMPVSMSFDQWNSIGFIHHLREYVDSRQCPKRVDIWERPSNRQLNWETYETFKNAIGLGLVRAPFFELARVELMFLRDLGGKVEPPTTGLVITKDVADCMAIIVHTMIGAQVAALMGKRLMNVPVRGMAQGGIDPSLQSVESNDPGDLLSRYGRDGRGNVATGAPVSPARGGKFNPDGTIRSGLGRRTPRGLPKFRN
jgi:hypothetical protein